MRRKAGRPPIEDSLRPPLKEKIELVKWHIDRYDRLRASTASRASVVLSAGTILSAGNAVVLSQLLSSSGDIRGWLLAAFSTGIVASASLIVLAVIRATGVLVSLRLARRMFPADDLPAGLVFNATDTVHHLKSFTEFRALMESQDYAQILEAAQVELWIVVRQHRHRYSKLRGAVRALRRAALAFLMVLIALVIVNLVLRS